MRDPAGAYSVPGDRRRSEPGPNFGRSDGMDCDFPKEKCLQYRTSTSCAPGVCSYLPMDTVGNSQTRIELEQCARAQELLSASMKNVLKVSLRSTKHELWCCASYSYVDPDDGHWYRVASRKLLDSANVRKEMQKVDRLPPEEAKNCPGCRRGRRDVPRRSGYQSQVFAHTSCYISTRLYQSEVVKITSRCSYLQGWSRSFLWIDVALPLVSTGEMRD